MARIRINQNQSVKKQWYIFYCLVLLIPTLVMLTSYRLSYNLLAETVYDHQSYHLTIVKDIVDTEMRSINATMLSFIADQQIRQAINVKNPSEEKQMPLFRDVSEFLYNAALNHTLLKSYYIYLPDSDYVIGERHIIARRLLAYEGYQGTLLEGDCQVIFDNAQSNTLGLMRSKNNDLVVYMKVPVYRKDLFLYTAAVLSSNELVQTLNNGVTLKENLIGIESLDGQFSFCNDQALNELYQSESSSWFYQEVESGILPLRYYFASPRYVVEEKLIMYRYMIVGFMSAALVLGFIVIRLAVKKQYEPIEHLMKHFSDNERTLNNEYTNISTYLLQAQSRNDHHFMTDILLGNIPDSHAFAYSQLLLLTHADESSVFHLDTDSALSYLPNTKIVNLYERTVIISQDSAPSEAQIQQALNLLCPSTQFYAILARNDGQTLHQAYMQAADTLTTLRFFHAQPAMLYHATVNEHEPSLMLTRNSFEADLRSALIARNEEHAKEMMQSALDELKTKCHTGSLLRSSLYTISLLFIRLEASVRAQSPNVEDGVSGEVVRSYRYTAIEQLHDAAMQGIHDMIAALELQNNRKNNSIFDQIDAFLHENYSNPDLNIDMIAEKVGFSAAYLRRIYKQNAGSSVMDAVLRLRINAAKQLLTDSTVKVSDVATLVGFWDVGTFIRSFKKIEGITPGSYRDTFTSQSFDNIESE